MLPSEAEWEKAARGDDFDASRASCGDHGLGTTSSVGLFPDGASPAGCLDMSGNVWEWTRSLWGPQEDEASHTNPYQPGDDQEDLSASDSIMRVVRGGAFYSSDSFLRAAFRHGDPPDRLSGRIGVRLVCSRSQQS